MTRPTLKQLAYNLSMAGLVVHRDRYYQHQASGKVYKVIGHALHEATGEPMALYRPAATNRKAVSKSLGVFERPEDECVFARPVSEFFDEVEWHDREMMRKGPRFKEVVKVEQWVTSEEKPYG